MSPQTRIVWVPEDRVWTVWLGLELLGWRSSLLEAEKLGIYESERREAGAA